MTDAHSAKQPVTPAVGQDVWADGVAYNIFMGRWSQLVAREFLAWLGLPPGQCWLDIGCGTGMLSQTILELAAPASVQGFDRAAQFVMAGRHLVGDARASFEVADAASLPVGDGSFDAAVSGLMLNFVPEPLRVVQEMARVTRNGGTVALYVWDYAVGMEYLRHFWDAAIALDPGAQHLDEGRRFPICRPQPLAEVFSAAGLHTIGVEPIDVGMQFRDFDDFWMPFLGGQGPAPTYVMALDAQQRAALRAHLFDILGGNSGPLRLAARAWAVRGQR
ncbi:MAG TPA: class I SAM-dependent methyltransferase [Roseiflexaceae bacterium]|nr:class I SAM-dependent methyltransferase [Roseiflexaceae bacterium]